jgi:hypothetical protein
MLFKYLPIRRFRDYRTVTGNLVRYSCIIIANMSDLPMKIYAFDETIHVQMARLTTIRENDPELAKKMIAKGESLVEYSKSGSLRKLSIFTSVTEKQDILYYYVVQSFKECLKNGHFMMTDHLLDHGFPLCDPTIPPVLIAVIPELEDYQGVNIVSYLGTKGYDMNLQVRSHHGMSTGLWMNMT